MKRRVPSPTKPTKASPPSATTWLPSSTISSFAASSKSVDTRQQRIDAALHLPPAKSEAQENQFCLSVIACSNEKGDSDKLRLLTAARAKVVRDYLTQNYKLDDKRVKTIGPGKSKSADESSKLVVLVYPPCGPAQHSPSSGSSSANLQRDGQRWRNLTGRMVEEVIRFTRRVHFFCS